MAKQAQELRKVYKYKKFCKLGRCGKMFETNRDWQDYCEPAHQKEYQNLRRRSETDIRKELNELKKEQEKIKQQLEVKHG